MQRRLARQAKISREEAEKKALERVPGTVIESELEKEKGKIIYEFEVKTRENKIFEVLVDAKTGEIIDIEEETGEDDDGEDTDHARAQLRKAGNGLSPGAKSRF